MRLFPKAGTPIPDNEGATAQAGVVRSGAVKQIEAKPANEGAFRAEPEPSVPESPATSGDKSALEIVPSPPLSLDTRGEAQAPVAKKGPSPNDGGATAKGGIAKDTKSRSNRYAIRIGSFEDRKRAEEMKMLLKEKGYSAFIKTLKQPVSGEIFVIQLRSVYSFSKATTLTAQLSSEVGGEPEIIQESSR